MNLLMPGEPLGLQGKSVNSNVFVIAVAMRLEKDWYTRIKTCQWSCIARSCELAKPFNGFSLNNNEHSQQEPHKTDPGPFLCESYCAQETF
ncbi:unnamed protein product [Boreogadus saida]